MEVGFGKEGEDFIMGSEDLACMVGNDETILWRGKPDKKCFVLEAIFNPMLIVAIIWGAFDFGIIGMSMFGANGGMPGNMAVFIVVFMLIHLMPVWIYLGGVIFAVRRYKNTAYIVTDRGIYVSGGIFSYTYEMKPFAELSHINLHRGIFDQMLGVGDIVLSCHPSMTGAQYTRNTGNTHMNGLKIVDITDYQRVFKLIKDLQTDIYADTMYPNDLRPETNHGYKTKYRGM